MIAYIVKNSCLLVHCKTHRTGMDEGKKSRCNYAYLHSYSSPFSTKKIEIPPPIKRNILCSQKVSLITSLATPPVAIRGVFPYHSPSASSAMDSKRKRDRGKKKGERRREHEKPNSSKSSSSPQPFLSTSSNVSSIHHNQNPDSRSCDEDIIGTSPKLSALNCNTQALSIQPSSAKLSQEHIVSKSCDKRVSVGNSSCSSTSNVHEKCNANSIQSPSNTSGPMVPMRRPDRGGSSCSTSLNLVANNFRVTISDTAAILHYLINIKLEGSKKSDKNAEISKSELLSIKNKLFKANPDEFPPSSIAYDGESNLFSSVQLPVSKFSVELHRCKYTVSIEFKKNLELTRLWGHPIPEELLHGLNVIIKEDSVRQRIKYGQSLYSRSKDCAFNIGRGITALQGTRQACASTQDGFVYRVDYTTMPFCKPGLVLQFLEQNLCLSFGENTQLSKQQRIAVENALRDLQVTVTHRKTSEKFTIIGLTRLNAVDITFSDDGSGKKVNLMEYYRKRYNIEFKFKKLPCLDLSTTNRMNYVPIELCELVEGQRYPRDGLRREEEKKMRDMALAAPAKRKEMILKLVSASDGPCRGELARSFGISLVREMTEVRARILERPSLRLRNLKGHCYKFKNQEPRGDWNPLKNKLLRGQKLENWAILDFSAAPACPKQQQQQQRLQIPAFVQSLVRRCRDLGIQICESPAFVNASSMAALSNYRRLAEELSKAKQSPDGRPVQLLICAMSERHAGYKSLKLICETELGVVTQCCLSFDANDANKRNHYLTNLALKINAKIGGTNVELYDPLPRIGGSRFMLIGADVNHPPCWNTASPSIAAVVATLDCPQPHTYTSRVRCQPRRVEQIVHLGEMCSELVAAYARVNKTRPEKIIYFRDGVGDGQFDMVLNKEVRDLESAIATDRYSPTITVVVAQKRHHTRLFPKAADGAAGSTARGGNGNVPPGTVVDTGIVDPSAFDFYLCSHHGSLGTSRPTHYRVLRDDHGFTSDELQGLVYNLCFTFARCAKPVSLVPPVYYADLVAYRARMYYESMSDLQSPTASTASASASSFSASSASASASASLDHSVLPKIHEKVQSSVMY